MKRANLKGLSNGTFRTAEFRGAQHLVIPIIALVQGVLHASNSPSPELVLAEEFQKAPGGWNGRPVMADHPQTDGQMISAGDPSVLEANQLGVVFNAMADADKLTMEAWINREMAEKAGQVRYLERIEAGEIVEVSVGVFVTSEESKGNYGGKNYGSVWREIVPDHLALLPEGTIGACSVEMGCGTRAASRKESRMNMLSLVRQFLGLKDVVGKDEKSSGELYSLLNSKLFETVPAFFYVEEVYPESSKVIYSCLHEGEYKLYSQDYAVEDGKVELKGKAVEVEVTTKYETAAAVKKHLESLKTASAECGCGGHKTTTSAETKEVMVDKKALIALVIANARLGFTSADEPKLEALSEAQLKAMSETPAEETPAPVEETPAPEGEVKVKSLADYLKDAPVEIKNIVDSHKKAETARRTELVSAMSKIKGCAFTKAELEALPIEQLEKLSKTVIAAAPEAVSFLGAGAPRAAASEDTGYADEPEHLFPAKQ